MPQALHSTFKFLTHQMWRCCACCLQLPQWYPLSIVKAGAAANSLVAGLNSQWGRKLYGKTLVRNIAKAIYKDKGQIESSFRSQASLYHLLAACQEISVLGASKLWLAPVGKQAVLPPFNSGYPQLQEVNRGELVCQRTADGV